MEKIQITKICPKCKKEFDVYRTKLNNGTILINKKERQFCNKICANSHIQTAEQNKSRHDKMKGRITNGAEPAKLHFCLSCGNKIGGHNRTHKCLNCWNDDVSPYTKYVNKCKFRFNVLEHPNEFNLDLVKKYGWYSPANKNNNIGGVSKDHKIPLVYGWDNNIPWEVMAHPANCDLLIHSENSSKHINCSITLEDLKTKILNWDQKYN